MNAPQYAENTITEYHITQNNIYGANAPHGRYDLMSAVMICLSRDDTKATKHPLLKLLSVLLSERLTVEEKQTILQNEFQIDTQPIEKELNAMCNLSDLIEEKGIQQGKILAFFETGLDIPRIAQRMLLSESEVSSVLTKAGILKNNI